MARFFFSRGGALLEEASAFKKYFEPGLRPARVAINQRGFINQELTLGRLCFFLVGARFFVPGLCQLGHHGFGGLPLGHRGADEPDKC